MIDINKKFWKRKKVLVTGHTGFTGTWLVHLLTLLGSEVYGISLDKNFNESFFKKSKIKIKETYFDLSKKNKIDKLIKKINPDVVFHLAAQSILKKGLENTYDTYFINYIGTLNILNSVQQFKKKITLIITTTDKVYFNSNLNKSFVEDDKLGATEPYSASKVAQDYLSSSYYESKLKNKKNFGVGILRAGNIIGGGDMNEARLIPDLIKHIYKKKTIKIRDYNAARPWQHIIQVCYGYLLSAEKIHINPLLSGPYNIGPIGREYQVKDIIKLFRKHYNFNEKLVYLSKNVLKEKKKLSINSKKAIKKLGYRNIISFTYAMNLTFNWYDKYFEKKSIKKLIQSDLKKFFKLA